MYTSKIITRPDGSKYVQVTSTIEAQRNYLNHKIRYNEQSISSEPHHKSATIAYYYINITS